MAKSEDRDDAEEAVPVTADKPKSKKRWIGILATLVLMIGTGVVGTVQGPKMMARYANYKSARAKATKHQPSPDAEPPFPENPKAFQPIIVDVRDQESETRHMKVGLTVELVATVTKDQFEKLTPRGREAAIAYLRTRRFEELTEPSQFAQITKGLSNQVVKAMGKKYAYRVVITDYVAQ
jgi:flagellar basal body-associated protein FliL